MCIFLVSSPKVNLLSHFCTWQYFKDGNLWCPLAPFLGEIDIGAYWLFSIEFNAQFLFKAFLDVMCIFGSVEPQSESILPGTVYHWVNIDYLVRRRLCNFFIHFLKHVLWGVCHLAFFRNMYFCGMIYDTTPPFHNSIIQIRSARFASILFYYLAKMQTKWFDLFTPC